MDSLPNPRVLQAAYERLLPTESLVQPMIEPRRFSRVRLVVFDTFERLAVLLGGRALHRRRLEADRVEVRDEVIEVPGLPAELDGFRIAHLSDIHAGPFLGAGDLEGVVERVAEEDPDVVCWTGDYVVHGIENALPVLPELRRLTGRRATFAVFGNHDYKARREYELSGALEGAGWRFLRNEGQLVRTQGGAAVGFAGIEDPEEGKVVDPEAATAGLGDADVVIALSHGPLGAPALAACGADVVLSGHTHGTQVDLPFLRDLGPAHPGLRVQLGGTTLIVTRGLGVIGVPLRSGVPAEFVVITLRSAAPAAD